MPPVLRFYRTLPLGGAPLRKPRKGHGPTPLYCLIAPRIMGNKMNYF